MALRIGDLVGFIRADDSGMRRGLSDAELRMRGFQRGMDGRLRDLRGRFVSESGLIGRALGDGVGDGGDRAHRSLGGITRLAGGLAGVAASVGGIAAKLGAAAPVAAGLAATLVSIAPAAAVAATGIAAVVLANATLKIGLMGVGDAITEAFSGDDPEKLAEAMKKLAPNAQAFVKALQGLKPELKSIQQSVQNRLFTDLGTTLTQTATAVLPVLRTQLDLAAGSLNLMGRQVLNTATGLSKSGALGQALSGANAGIRNLIPLPAAITQGLVQLAAAAAPTFNRLTAQVGSAVTGISDKLANAFASGRLQQAIEQAVSLIGDLAEVAVNVGKILYSVFSAAQVSGGGFIGTLQQVTGALAAAFASPGVQEGLRAIFQTMSTVAKTVAPLLGQAIAVLAPVFAALGPPVQILVKALGSALSPIIEALGPVLTAAATAVGALVTAAAPLLVVVGQLVAALLPSLQPLLDGLTVVFIALAPVVATLAGILMATLKPILAALPGIIKPLAELLAQRLVFSLQLLGQILVATAPALLTLGQSLGELLVALSPLISAFAVLSAESLAALVPVITPIIRGVGQLATIFAQLASRYIEGVVIPAVKALTSLLRGDFDGAMKFVKQSVSGMVNLVIGLFRRLYNVLVGHSIVPDMVNAIVRWFAGLPGRAAAALGSLGARIAGRARDAGASLVRAVRSGIDSAVRTIRGLPGRAASARGGLGGRLYGAGQSLIRGFISGIKSMFGSVSSTLGDLTSKLTSWKGPESLDKRLLTPAGRYLIEGFQRGIGLQTPSLERQLGGLTGALPGVAVAGAAGGGPSRAASGTQRVVVEFAGPAEMTRIFRKVVKDTGGGSVQKAWGSN